MTFAVKVYLLVCSNSCNAVHTLWQYINTPAPVHYCNSFMSFLLTHLLCT